jgi:hypothetical protein
MAVSSTFQMGNRTAVYAAGDEKPVNFEEFPGDGSDCCPNAMARAGKRKSRWWDLNPQPPLYECVAGLSADVWQRVSLRDFCDSRSANVSRLLPVPVPLATVWLQCAIALPCTRWSCLRTE